VVFHDPVLADRRPIHTVDFHALPALARGVRIPTLEEALEVCRDRIVNIELKADLPSRARLARKAVRAVRRAPRAEIVWSSFHPFLVLAVAALSPREERAILVGGKTRRLGTALPLAMRGVVRAAHLEHRLGTPSRIKRLSAVGLRIAAWTVNDPDRARSLVAAGVSWIITDRPAAITS
jgi:glycerophosphoryl diester phosphodiesterase